MCVLMCVDKAHAQIIFLLNQYASQLNSLFHVWCVLVSVLQRVSVCGRLSPDRQQHRSDLWQVPSLFLEPGERHAGQETRTV